MGDDGQNKYLFLFLLLLFRLKVRECVHVKQIKV